MVEVINWYFPAQWLGVTIALLLFLLLTILSYYWTKKNASLKAKSSLIILRIIFFSFLIFCLANPTKVKVLKSTLDKDLDIAVVLDSSGSMHMKTEEGETRFQYALKYIKDHLSEQSRGWNYHYFEMQEHLSPVFDLNDFSQSQNKFKETYLYQNILQWQQEFDTRNIDAVICLTDGEDTTDAKLKKKSIQSMARSGVPHAFVPMLQKIQTQPYVRIEKCEIDSVATPPSNVPGRIFVEFTYAKGQTFQLKLKHKDEILYDERIKINRDHELRSFRFNCPIWDYGSHHFQVEIEQNEKRLAESAWSIHAHKDERQKILFFQGALDWGTRHLKKAFGNKESISIDFRNAKSIYWKIKDRGRGAQFPNFEQLKKYHCVVLLNLNHDQLTPNIVRNLRNYLKSGGSVLFLASNPVAASEYASSPLEEFLPIRFQATGDKGRREDRTTKRMMDLMGQIGYKGRVRNIENSIQKKEDRVQVLPMYDFEITKDGMTSPIFKFCISNGRVISEKLPKFQQYGVSHALKPGARSLAEYTDKNGNKRILLATQTFGKGRIAALTTDTLWRWKLSIPHDDPAYTLFWQHLLFWLGAGKHHHPHWVMPSVIYEASRKHTLSFSFAEHEDYKFDQMQFEYEVSGKKYPLELYPGEDDGIYQTKLDLKESSVYRISARVGEKVVSENYFSTSKPPLSKELQYLNSGQGLMEELKEKEITVIEGDHFAWDQWLPRYQKEIKNHSEKALWHEPWIFLIMIGIFLFELCLRRFLKLV